jgi:alkaline phosphatase
MSFLRAIKYGGGRFILEGLFVLMLSVPIIVMGQLEEQSFQVYLPAFRAGHCWPGQALAARHVILFIGDGMGFEHVKAGGMYLNGAAGTLSFEAFPYQAELTTHPAGSQVTDSAAAATAMATGEKVQNGVVSIAIPGDGQELYTLLEYARDRCLSTGLVTTTVMTHATPAGFGAHTPNRADQADIAGDYLMQTRPNLLLGGGGSGLTPGAAEAAGYSLVTDRASLLALEPETLPGSDLLLAGQFGGGHMPYEVDGTGSLPHLNEMTRSALTFLDDDPDGFFLMVEGGRIDHASHSNDARRMVGEVAEFSRAVQMALDWARQHPDTLILVTADHETGGLRVASSSGRGNVPVVAWSTPLHTGARVPVYLYGRFSGTLPPLIDNTQVPDILSGGNFP